MVTMVLCFYRYEVSSSLPRKDLELENRIGSSNSKSLTYATSSSAHRSIHWKGGERRAADRGEVEYHRGRRNEERSTYREQKDQIFGDGKAPSKIKISKF
jgi:hypothetical protein